MDGIRNESRDNNNEERLQENREGNESRLNKKKKRRRIRRGSSEWAKFPFARRQCNVFPEKRERERKKESFTTRFPWRNKEKIVKSLHGMEREEHSSGNGSRSISCKLWSETWSSFFAKEKRERERERERAIFERLQEKKWREPETKGETRKIEEKKRTKLELSLNLIQERRREKRRKKNEGERETTEKESAITTGEKEGENIRLHKIDALEPKMHPIGSWSRFPSLIHVQEKKSMEWNESLHHETHDTERKVIESEGSGMKFEKCHHSFLSIPSSREKMKESKVKKERKQFQHQE